MRPNYNLPATLPSCRPHDRPRTLLAKSVAQHERTANSKLRGKAMSDTREEAIRAIEESDLFRGSQSKVIELVAESARLVTSPAHDWLFEAGQPVKSMYVLQSGLVCMADSTGSGQYAVIAVHGPGRVFGWSGLINPNSYLTSAYTLTEATAWELPVAALEALLAVENQLASVVYRSALELTYQNRQVCASHLRRGEDSETREERCPNPLVTSTFAWRLSGSMVEAMCLRPEACPVTVRAHCPLAPGNPANWNSLILRRFAPMLATVRVPTNNHTASPLRSVAA